MSLDQLIMGAMAELDVRGTPWDKREQLAILFDTVWEIMEEAGAVDAFGGEDYRRISSEFLGTGWASAFVDYIYERYKPTEGGKAQ
jgi:hypothetical protein